MYFSSPNIDFSGITQAMTEPVTTPSGGSSTRWNELTKEGGAWHGAKSKRGRFGKVGSYFKRATENVEDYGKRAKKKSIEGYRRYKDPIIVGGSALLGGLLGSVVPGVGTMAGAAAGASIAGGARGIHNQKKAERAARASSDDFLNYFGGGRRMTNKKRQAGEGDVSFSTMEDVV